MIIMSWVGLTLASQKDKCESLWGLHRPANFLQTPLPFGASWCYHNPGPRVDLCGSWPRLPLPHVCVTLSAERPDSASCQVGEGLYSNVGNRKRKWTRPGLGERMEGTEHNIYPPSPSIIYKQLCHIFKTVKKKLSLASVHHKSNYQWIPLKLYSLTWGPSVQSSAEQLKNEKKKICMCICVCVCWPIHALLGCGVSESQAMSLVWHCTLNRAWSSDFNGCLSRVWLWRLWSGGNAMAFDF